MNTKTTKAAAVTVVALLMGAIAFTPTARSVEPVAAPQASNLMGVRVQWIDLAGNHPHTDCTVHIVNKSLTEQISIEQFIVLGPGGRLDVIGTSPMAIGTTIEPLGELRVPINGASIPGAAPQTSVGAHGVRNAIVKWVGPSDAMHLEAVQERYATGQTDQRTHWVSRGYAMVE